MGTAMRADLSPASAALQGVRPALLRALGEVALPQVREYYKASLEYGRNTTPDNGLVYLGNAAGQRDAVEFARSLSTPSSLQAPPVRSLHGELEALESDLLKAYRPPASIDQHGAFINASSLLKEARELDAAGLRYGALLRYLQAAKLVAPLRQGGSPAAGPGDLEGRLRDCDAAALRREAWTTASAGCSWSRRGDEPTPETLALMVNDVLPRYFAALEPGRPEPPRPPARAGHGHARALALHLKPLRSSRSAGTKRGAGVRRQGAVRGRELRRLGAGEAVRRQAVSGDLRGRRAGGDAEGLRLLRQGRRRGQAGRYAPL